ncbi:MAG TPA: trypsin-like peptidase domain-containing protein [Actinomycetes bacterium]
MTETTSPLPPYQPLDSHVGGGAPHDPWSPPQQPPPPQPPAPPRRGPRRGVALLVAVALGAGLVGGGAGAALTAATEDKPAVVNALDAKPSGADAPTGSVERVAAAVLPSVVSIEVRTAGGGGEGTGVILSSDGLILTNNHVVAAAAQGGTLRVTFNDGTSKAATIVGRDPVTDLAVIRAQGASGLRPATLGDSSTLDPGQAVVAIGSPLGLQGTVTSGIVSALDRPVRTGGGDASGEDRSTVIDAIQTDAAINPGNSGGPLVDMQGRVVGINSAIASLGSGLGGQSGSIGLGFAIPANQARRIADQLTKTGQAVHAQLGVSVSDASSSSGETGAGIAAVQPGSAAAKAGLRAGDVVTRVGDRAVDSADALIAAVRSQPPGAKVTLTVVRDGSTRTTAVTLGSDGS